MVDRKCLFLEWEGSTMTHSIDTTQLLADVHIPTYNYTTRKVTKDLRATFTITALSAFMRYA